MQQAPTEVEVKFHVQRLADLAKRIEDLGAVLVGARVLEHNLRFDTPDERLKRDREALRLRHDASTTLTFKGPSTTQDGIRIRTEIETRVDDFSRTRMLLESLGYVVTFEYEKFRTTYTLAGTSIMLDELPYGEFIEIEGDMKAIQVVAGQLGLRWEAAIEDTYRGLFERLRARYSLPFTALTFGHFSNHTAHVRDLGVAPADA